MLTESALCTLHCKVELCPALIEGGVAVKLAITGTPTVTVTVILQVAFPPGPRALTVYVVVCAGFTETVPVLSTCPMPGVMKTLLALTLVHASVDDWPAAMVGGVAVHPVSCTWFGVVSTTTVTDAVSSFTLLRAVRIYVVVCVGETEIDPFTDWFPRPAIFTVSAFSVFQVSIDDCPVMI